VGGRMLVRRLAVAPRRRPERRWLEAAGAAVARSGRNGGFWGGQSGGFWWRAGPAVARGGRSMQAVGGGVRCTPGRVRGSRERNDVFRFDYKFTQTPQSLELLKRNSFFCLTTDLTRQILT
jgi:hypothetical protein